LQPVQDRRSRASKAGFRARRRSFWDRDIRAAAAAVVLP
jgi:hypothetical protein